MPIKVSSDFSCQPESSSFTNYLINILMKKFGFFRNSLLRSNIRLIWYKDYSLRNNRFSIGTMEAPCHRKSKQRLLPWFTVAFLISLENFLDCFGNALFAFPGLKRTQSQDRIWFYFPGNAVHVERFIHSKKGGKTGERKK